MICSTSPDVSKLAALQMLVSKLGLLDLDTLHIPHESVVYGF